MSKKPTLSDKQLADTLAPELSADTVDVMGHTFKVAPLTVKHQIALAPIYKANFEVVEEITDFKSTGGALARLYGNPEAVIEAFIIIAEAQGVKFSKRAVMDSNKVSITELLRLVLAVCAKTDSTMRIAYDFFSAAVGGLNMLNGVPQREIEAVAKVAAKELTKQLDAGAMSIP